jgi:hypothetical protein
LAYNFVESIFLHVNWKEIRESWGEGFVKSCVLGKKLKVFSKYIFISPTSSLEIYERCVMHEKWELNILRSLFLRIFNFFSRDLVEYYLGNFFDNKSSSY